MKAILLLAFVALASAMRRYTGCKVLRVITKDGDDVHWLRENEFQSRFQIWNSLRKGGHPFDIMVMPDRFEEVTSLLTTRGLEYSVMVDDVQAKLDSQTLADDSPSDGHTAALSDFQYDIYHTYEQINQWIDDMEAEHTIVSKFTLTQSYEGRNINGIRLSSGTGDADKPIVWFEGGIHAREWISPATVMFISKSLVEDYEASETRVTAILNGFDFYIVPSLNVDGFVYTHTTDRLWRKTRSQNPNFGCVGADPNRNWPYGWGGSGSSPWPCTNVYRGASPLSEVEVKGVVDFLTNLKTSGRETKMFIDWHSYSQVWLAPWSYSESATLPADWLDQDNLAAAATQALENVHGTKYQKGGSAIILYEAAGASCDWAYGTLGAKYSYVVELRDTGKDGFVLPADQIIPTGEESYQGILAGLEYALAN